MKSAELRASTLISEYVASSANPDLREYGRKFVDGDGRGARHRWFIRELCRLGGVRSGTVLDIGCGFGWDSIAIALIGDPKLVIANDIRESMTAPLQSFLDNKCAEGHRLPIRTLTGDICDLDIAPNSLDSIICNQTLEHVHDLDRMFDRCSSLLRPRGRAVFTNDNNALNRRGVDEIAEMWRRRDSDPAYTEELKRQRPIENAEVEPYAAMRCRIVSEANSSLSQDQVERISKATAGLTRAEIEPIAAQYRDGHALPVPPPLSWCRNPITGEYCERQLDPFEVCGQLRNHGFRASVRHGFRKLPLRLLNGIGWRWLNTTLFQYRPFFIVVAVRI